VNDDSKNEREAYQPRQRDKEEPKGTMGEIAAGSGGIRRALFAQLGMAAVRAALAAGCVVGGQKGDPE